MPCNILCPTFTHVKMLNQKSKKMKYSKFRLASVIISITIIASALSSCNIGSNKQNEADKDGKKAPATDIHTAVVVGDLESIRGHIEAGTDLNAVEPLGGSTALITAIVLDKGEIARALIDAGADIDKSNNDGSTPLYCAAFFGRTDLVKVLLEEGADKNIRNNFGSTALESVSVPFEDIRPIYDQISKDMGPLGLKLDYKKLQEARKEIATLLQ